VLPRARLFNCLLQLITGILTTFHVIIMVTQWLQFSLNCIVEFLPVHLGLGHAVAQLVEAPRYKPEGRGIDSRWCNWNFSGRTMNLGLTQPLTEMSTSWGTEYFLG
jgi:hypothetical protein